MEITKGVVTKLLRLIGGGIQSGAGEMEGPGTFCIQQAVSMATGQPDSGDQPEDCIGYAIRSWGVQMNDQSWSSPEARANGMRRYAVAQLGSNVVDPKNWAQLFCENWNNRHPEIKILDPTKVFQYCKTDAQRSEACEIATLALQVLQTRGCDYLYLCDPETPKAHKDMMKRIYCDVPQMLWRGGYGRGARQGHFA